MKRYVCRAAFSAAVLLALSFAVLSQEKTIPSPWKVDDLINLEFAQDFRISPDGNWTVWIKNTPDREKDRRISQLFLTGLKAPFDTIQLTRGEDGAARPSWSPSGKLVSFLKTGKGGEAKGGSAGGDDRPVQQVWLLDTRGGEPWQATTLAMGVQRCEWLDDGRLLLLAREPMSLRELEARKKKDASYVAEDQEHMTPQRLFIFDIQKKKAARLTRNSDQITDFDLSFNKKMVLTRNNQSVRYEVDKKIKPRFFLVGLEDGSSVELFTDPGFKPWSLAWTKDDRGFYFSVTRTSDTANDGPGASLLYRYDLASKSYEEVPLDWEWGLEQPGTFEVREDGFVAALSNGARLKWRRYTRSAAGYAHKDLEGKHVPNVYEIVLQEAGNAAVYFYSKASLPGQWFLGTLEGNSLQPVRSVTDLNAHLKNKTMARTEVVKWAGALDDEIEGILYYPHDYREGRRYPLFLSIHGGPTGVDRDLFDESWASYPNLLAQKGSFVLLPNYHGSGGYGQKFVESIKGHYYEYEIPDMLNGIDVLVKKGMVDPDRLGTMGWSNGGILSIALSVWTKRFKVAGIGAADVNWTSDYGNCAFGVSFDNYYFKGAPWDELEHYIQKSPLFHLKDMSVPTIIFHGTEDTSVPYSQGWEYFRALEQIGKAPVKFLIFPGEPHGLKKLTHQQRKIEEEIAWFDRHFFKTPAIAAESLKTGSPLDIALKSGGFARSGGGRFGKLVKGKLVPETVRFGAIEVGRFEVTRAQWAEFDAGFKVPPGTENYPASGITLEQAGKYLSWLKGLTGENYRLPSVAEAERLAGRAGQGDNTLDYWAGYPLNVDDAVRLLEKSKALGDQAPLLLPVDRFQPAGEELIFGLGGGVAEWAADGAGTGRILGLSAASRADAVESYLPPPMDYVGLRVVK